MAIIRVSKFWLVIGLVVLLLSACRSPSGSGPIAPIEVLPDESAVSAAKVALSGLPVIPKPSFAADYRRDAFGKPWFDVDGNGCNTRDDVLISTVLTDAPYSVRSQRSCRNDMVSGSWIDPFSGQKLTFTNLKNPKQAEQLQIDHIVPLSLAFRYGARDWTAERRLAFANDLDNLVPVAGASNQAKGGSGPEDWLPPANKCWYATKFVLVKAKYQLATSRQELRALNSQLAKC